MRCTPQTATSSSRPALLRLVLGGAAVALALPIGASAAAAAAPAGGAGQASALLQCAAQPGGPRVTEPRVIVTTDPELDDLNSMLRMLLYSNEINIAGLVYSSSQHHYVGDPSKGIAPHRWPEPGARLHIDEALDAYAQVHANLVEHDPRYPTPEHLRSLVAVGNIKNVGEMAEDTAGSDLIKKILLDDQPGQVFLQAWGGPNTIARALKSIEDEYKNTPQWPAIYAKIVDKAVLTSWGQQDTTFEDYIKPNWPDLEHREVATTTWGYFARRVVLPADQHLLSPEWTRENVSEVGPIGAAYRVWGDGKQMAAGFDDEDYFGLSGYTAEQLRAMGYLVWMPPQAKDSWISEGDSSNFALLIDNGLRNWEHPSWGGWGGRQIPHATDPARWTNRGAVDAAPDGTTPPEYSVARWFSAIQNDFAARLQWSVTDDPDEANHHPTIRMVRGSQDIRVRPGLQVQLRAAVEDCDGDAVTYRWWQYEEADTYAGRVQIGGATSNAPTFTVPADAKAGDTIHLILEVTDNGTPALTEYQRVVLTVVDVEESLRGASALVQDLRSQGALSDFTTTGLLDRLERASQLAAIGSESRTLAYVQQAIARTENQVRGAEPEAALLAALQQIADDLRQSDQVEAP